MRFLEDNISLYIHESSKYGIRARQKFNQSSQTNFESRSLEQELGGGDVKYSLKKITKYYFC